MLKMVIFDLDDVLFPEISYIRSGFIAVAKSIKEKKEWQEIYSMMIQLFSHDSRNVFDRLVNEIAIAGSQEKAELVRNMITTYRAHIPKIDTYEDVHPVLNFIRNQKIFTAVVTDGYAITQREKIRALQLESTMDAIIVTDDLAPDKLFWKPNPYAFKMLLERFDVKPSKSCYIGDNVAKDFQGPASLGMHTIKIRRPDCLYCNNSTAKIMNEKQTIPEYVLNSLYDAQDLVLNLS